jgi:hypothetical protein
LGRFAASNQIADRRLVLGVSLPTREFAAALTALGVTTAVYRDPELQDPRANFERIAALAEGTAIRFRRERFLYAAKLRGTKLINGIEHLQYHDGEALCSLPWNRCNSITLLDPSESFARRRQLVANAEFVNGVLGVDPYSHAAVTSLDCLLVGVKELLQTEIGHETFLAHSSSAQLCKGTLNDLLRCDAFQSNANDHHRTSVLAGSIDGSSERVMRSVPPVVLFDSPQGFIRLRSYWQKSAWVVFLDRTKVPQVEAAAEVFNQERSLSVEDADLSSLGEPPAAFEVVGYYEATN